jgi:hypothetical protein
VIRAPDGGRLDRLCHWQPHHRVRRVSGSWCWPRIAGTPAMPKGLRHGFGVNAFQSNVPTLLNDGPATPRCAPRRSMATYSVPTSAASRCAVGGREIIGASALRNPKSPFDFDPCAPESPLIRSTNSSAAISASTGRVGGGR